MPITHCLYVADTDTAVDLGHWLSPRFGVRFNAAWEDSASYIDHADGRRNFYSLAADWLIGERGKLEVDANYQTSAQRSASGYQLLGARDLPRGVDREHMLGYQPWQRPVGIDSTNITALHTYQFNAQWQSRVSAGYSRSVIDDNVAFAYGCYYAAQCADGSVPGNYFAPNGDYDVYNLRAPAPGFGVEDTAAALVYSQISPFLQDTWQVNDQLSLTYGVRVNIPKADKAPEVSPGFEEAFGFRNDYKLGSSNKVVLPRFSFNYAFDTERYSQLRGGIGEL